MIIEDYKPGYKYSSSKQINNLPEWINWRAGVTYSADGPDGSLYGDSIAKVTGFTNKYGIYITELFVYVNCSMMEAEGWRNYISICGPVFAIKLNLPNATEEPVLFLRPNEWDVTNDERVILRLMVENFKYLCNY